MSYSTNTEAALEALQRERRSPVIFVTIVIAGVFASYLYQLRTDGIFACSASGYSSEGYLAYCNSLGYGDYDHGSIWFDFEPETVQAAIDADVLFLGSSRMQFGFSTGATLQWFEENSISHYLLGFSHSENIGFVAPLLQKISPQAVAYVINADHFFDDRTTEPAADILLRDDSESRYRRKRLWQLPHRLLCGTIREICGNSLGFFRTLSHGHWQFHGSDELIASGTGDAVSLDQESWDEYKEIADKFIARLPVSRECIILTVIPWAETPRAEAAYIARSLDVAFIAPSVDGLTTFDGSHLDPSSAETWSRQFYRLAEDRIRMCVDGSR